MPSNLQAVVKALAEQSFATHILANRLVELGVLKPDELNVSDHLNLYFFERSPEI